MRTMQASQDQGITSRPDVLSLCANRSVCLPDGE
jgi:hypothetical protein